MCEENSFVLDESIMVALDDLIEKVKLRNESFSGFLKENGTKEEQKKYANMNHQLLSTLISMKMLIET